MMRCLTIAAVLAGLCLSGGCQLLVSHYDEVPAGVMDMNRRSIAFIPMGYKRVPPFESEFGTDFANRVADRMKEQLREGEQKAKIEVRDVAPVMARLRSGEVQPDDWGLIGPLLEADYVIVGTILRDEVQGKPATTGALGYMDVRFDVYDVKNQTMAISRTVSHIYPRDHSFGMVEVDPSVTVEMFRRAMHAYVAEHLPWNFYNRIMTKTQKNVWMHSQQK